MAAPPYAGGWPAAGLKPHRGTLILVLGIVSVLLFQVLGIVPILLARQDLAEMDAGTMDPSGRGATNAGRILGMIALVLMAVGLVLVFILIALGIGLSRTG